MKKTIILSLLLAVCTMNASAQRISATNEVIDCGSVPYNVPVVAKFELRNKGKDLQIKNVRTSCGCATASYPKTIIPKGDKFIVEVTYDARQLGHFEKEAAIYSDASSEPYYLKIHGIVVDKVVEDFSANYDFQIGSIKTDINNIEFDDVNVGDKPVRKIHIYNSGSKEVTPVLMHLPSFLTATMSPTTIAPGRTGVATVTLNSSKIHDFGLTQSSIYLGMFPGDKVSSDKEITVSTVLLPAFRNMSETQKKNAPVLKLSSETLELGEFGTKAHKNGTIIIENQGRSTLNISSMQMFTAGLKVKLNKSKIKPGESAKLKITAYKKLLKNARSKPRVLMITNDPEKSKVTIKVNVK